MSKELSYCGQLVQKHDPDRFLISLFAQQEEREALWALFAFNHEIAKTREVVTEKHAGMLRLQWWKDEIAAIYAGKKSKDNEVLTALAAAVKAYNLPQAEFDELIAVRQFDLEEDPPENLDVLVSYAEYTNAPLLSLIHRICAEEGAPPEPIQAIAVNYALAGLLRAILFHASMRRCYLPVDMLEKYGLRTHLLFEGKEQENLPLVIKQIAQLIEMGVKPQNRVLKAVQAMAEINAKHLKRNKYNPLARRFSLPVPFKELRALIRVLTL